MRNRATLERIKPMQHTSAHLTTMQYYHHQQQHAESVDRCLCSCTYKIPLQQATYFRSAAFCTVNVIPCQQTKHLPLMCHPHPAHNDLHQRCTHPSNPRMRNAGGGSACRNSNAGRGSSLPSPAGVKPLLPRAAPATLFAITDASRRASHCCSCLRLALSQPCARGLRAAPAAAAPPGACQGVPGPSVGRAAGEPAGDSQDSCRYLASGTADPPGTARANCWCSSRALATPPLNCCCCSGW
ncbi:hypothetical protein COO60DRAFT_1156150 [Scenedesmus sp. NREL 46B-D3]|nr:hypothetical protein COO60DRAFT_1156150 [Scenedesmus sp. NREL 46B-D3]